MKEKRVLLSSLLSDHYVDWSKEVFCEGDNTIYQLYIEDGSRLTVLDRLTGYSEVIRDTETGFKDPEGKFWLASGMFDIREFKELTVAQAIEKVKQEANICVGFSGKFSD